MPSTATEANAQRTTRRFDVRSCAVLSRPSSPVDFLLLACCMQEEQETAVAAKGFRAALPCRPPLGLRGGGTCANF
jgi:hypothetical protein